MIFVVFPRMSLEQARYSGLPNDADRDTRDGRFARVGHFISNWVGNASIEKRMV